MDVAIFDWLMLFVAIVAFIGAGAELGRRARAMGWA